MRKENPEKSKSPGRPPADRGKAFTCRLTKAQDAFVREIVAETGASKAEIVRRYLKVPVR